MRLNVSISMLKRILSQKVIFANGYWVFITIFSIVLANYAVVDYQNSTKNLNRQNQIAKFTMFRSKVVFALFKFPSILRNVRKRQDLYTKRKFPELEGRSQSILLLKKTKKYVAVEINGTSA